MERSEPSLVPEWLKGAGGGVGAAHHSQPSIHQDDGGGSFLARQRSMSHGASAGANHGDFDSPRYAAASDRAFYPNGRRGANSTSVGASERPLFDRGDSYPRAYSSFGRSSGYRGYEGGSSSSSVDRDRERDRDRDGPRERDWDWEREFRDRERDRALGFGGGDDRDRDRDRPEASNFRRLGSGATGRYESDGQLRRSQSMGPRATENGEKKAPANADVAAPALPTAPPASVGSLTSSMQKAAFERNFPSLGAQEKQSAVQSGLGNMSSVLSPRISWQGSSPRPEGVRPPSASGTALPLPGGSGAGSVVTGSINVGGSGIGGEGWSSVLAEVPFTGGPSSTINGLTAVPNNATSGASAAFSGLTGPSSGVPKMSEALAQQPPRVRTPPQSFESMRMEETVLKQSRQLVPIKPSLPKNMGPRDKSKSKLLRAVDVVAPQPVKLNQPLASQLVSSPYRGPAPSRPELKAPQGKLLVRKNGKDAVAAVLSPSSSFKGDGGGTGGLTTATTAVNAAGSAVAGMGGATNSSISASGTSALAPAPRKQKQLLDRRAVPIPPISVPMGSEAGSGPRSGSALEDKRPSIPAQNRSDFFNALRKKAAGVGVSPNSLAKMEPASHQKNGMNENVVETQEDAGPFAGDASQKSSNTYPVKENGTVVSVTEAKSNLAGGDDYGGIINDVKENALSNGGSTERLEVNSDQSITAPNSPVATTNLATTTEEEEAFLRSLGWEESPEESGEGLTEEEINAFYQQRLRSVSISPALPTFRNHQIKDLKVGSIGSISSGISSSDSESDDDMHIRKRT